ncbi:MAG: FKBP-type peptidyl-prolyl cis-trans isomerase [Candidatus Altiarchaeota archaeon]
MAKKKTKKDEEELTEEGEKEKKINLPMIAFLLVVVLLIGVGIGYYISKLKFETEVPGEKTTIAATTTTYSALGEVATVGKVVTIDYLGKFENGTVFDTSIEEEAKKAGVYIPGRRYQPFTFALGKGQVIQGFEDGILGMRAGEEKEFSVPPSKGYSIGPLAGKTLIFKVWLRKVAEPLKIPLTVVNDPNCKSCDTSTILTITENLFPGVQVRTVDSNSNEGKELIEKYNIIFLPAYIFDSVLANDPNYEANAEVFEKVKDKYLLKSDVTRANYYANEEARKKAEELAKKKAEEKCNAINKKDKPELNAFVVSYCPFGLQMQRILIPVNELLGKVADIKLRYIGSVVNNKITAMHGDQEAQENLRQICIREEQKDKFFPYLDCFIKEGKTDDCIKEVKIDKEKLTSCMNDTSRGIAYAKEDFSLQDKYSVSGSPTLILNGAQVNEFDFGGRTAEAVKTLICCGFKTKPDVCNKTLDTRQAATYFAKDYASSQTSSTGSCG